MHKVSIVIPVYNEGERIAACLEAIARQTHKPYEVIVVDNNSTDSTAEVVRRYSFARLITAKRQGVVHARNRGFNAVRGDIIGRIDADTRLPENWVAQVQALFADGTIDAASGAVRYHDMPFSHFASMVDLALRRRAARQMADEVFLQGANMAVRGSAWRAVRSHLCLRGGLHEDYDLAIHLAQAGRRVVFEETLKADISARCLDDTISDFWTYALLSPNTYAQHESRNGRHMYLIVTLILIFHVPLRMLYRGYDSKTKTFSLSRAFGSTWRRVNPATFVD